jgi:hypothetical protein
MAITTAPASSQLSPGAQAHHEVQLAYDFFNRELFRGDLPPCFVSFQRKGSRARGYFCSERLATAEGSRADEIALNPRHFRSRTFIEIMSTLVHEMVHQWQHHFGRRHSRTAYHNKEWAGEMLRIGLHPSHTGEPGGRMTGQTMSHFVMPGGLFQTAAQKLSAMLPSLTWFDADAAQPLPKGLVGSGLMPLASRSGRRTIYQCPTCKDRAQGKSTLFIICGNCETPMAPVGHR